MNTIPKQLIVITAVFCSFSAYAGISGKQGMPEQGRRTEQTRQASNLSGKVRIQEVAQRIGLPAAEVQKFFKEELNSGRADMTAWGELAKAAISVKRNASKEDLLAQDTAANTLHSYLLIRQSKQADNLHVREKDLAEILVSEKWTPAGRENLAKVLRRTSELLTAKNSKFATTEDAFNQALKDTGFASKYNKCRL